MRGRFLNGQDRKIMMDKAEQWCLENGWEFVCPILPKELDQGKAISLLGRSSKTINEPKHGAFNYSCAFQGNNGGDADGFSEAVDRIKEALENKVWDGMVDKRQQQTTDTNAKKGLSADLAGKASALLADLDPEFEGKYPMRVP